MDTNIKNGILFETKFSVRGVASFISGKNLGNLSEVPFIRKRIVGERRVTGGSLPEINDASIQRYFRETYPLREIMEYVNEYVTPEMYKDARNVEALEPFWQGLENRFGKYVILDEVKEQGQNVDVIMNTLCDGTVTKDNSRQK